jgi:hypothetical protein
MGSGTTIALIFSMSFGLLVLCLCAAAAFVIYEYAASSSSKMTKSQAPASKKVPASQATSSLQVINPLAAQNIVQSSPTWGNALLARGTCPVGSFLSDIGIYTGQYGDISGIYGECSSVSDGTTTSLFAKNSTALGKYGDENGVVGSSGWNISKGQAIANFFGAQNHFTNASGAKSDTQLQGIDRVDLLYGTNEDGNGAFFHDMVLQTTDGYWASKQNNPESWGETQGLMGGTWNPGYVDFLVQASATDPHTNHDCSKCGTSDTACICGELLHPDRHDFRSWPNQDSPDGKYHKTSYQCPPQSVFVGFDVGFKDSDPKSAVRGLAFKCGNPWTTP